MMTHLLYQLITLYGMIRSRLLRSLKLCRSPGCRAELAMERMNVEREDLASSVAQQLAAVPAPHTSSVLERSERAMLWQVSLVWRAWEEEEG